MAKKQIIIRRGKVVYVLNQDSVIVGVGAGQWISYNQYFNWNRQGLTQFRNTIAKSRENQYCTAAEQMSLAAECGIIGTGTHAPKGLDL